jgi:RHS repeat-associated protein
MRGFAAQRRLIFVVASLALCLCNTASAQQPDLTPTSLTAPSVVSVQQPTTVTWTVRNQGTGDAGARYDDFYLSTDSTWDSGDTYIEPFYFSDTLFAATSHTETAVITMPGVPSGNYYLIVRADAYDYVSESDESNNNRAIPITVRTPDLIPTSLTALPIASTQQPTTVTWTVRNQGQGDAYGNPGWYDAFYISTDNVYDAQDTYTASVWYDSTPLAAGTSYTITQPITMPGVAPGNYYLILRTDGYYNYLYESNEANNDRAIPITIQTPDLIPTSFTAPAVVSSQQPTTVTWTVRNQGTSVAGARWDGFYISADNVLDDQDTFTANVLQNETLLGGTSQTITDVIATPGVHAGNYYLILYVDSYYNVYESNELNNEYAVPITIRTPDLIPTSFTAPSIVSTQQPTTVTWTVRNQGTGDAFGAYEYWWWWQLGWYDTFYLSNDNVYDEQDTHVASVWYPSSPLAAGTSYTITQPITMPGVPAGNYYLILRVDGGNYLFESNESNNDRAIPITLRVPDLTPTSMTAPAAVSTQQEVMLAWRVSNQGTGDAYGYGGWYDGIYFSIDNVWDDQDWNIGYSWRTGVVLAGTDYRQTGQASIPQVPDGDYFLIIRADSSNYVYESNELNNDRAVPIRVGTPDLSPISLAAPATAATHQDIQISWRVRNQGTAPAQPYWYDRLYLSTDNVWDNQDVEIGSGFLWNGVVTDGTSYTQTVAATVPGIPAGNYFLILRGDGYNILYESNEANNDRAVAIHITNPDLTPISIMAPDAAAQGQQIAVSWRVRNQGNGDAYPGWYDDVYLSTDTLVSAGDTYLQCAWQDQVVLAGSSYTQTVWITTPNVPPGNYYLIVRTDAYNYLYESSEANNTIFKAMRVGAFEEIDTPYRKLDSQSGTWLDALDFSPDGVRLVANGGSIAYVWDVQTGSIRRQFTAHTATIDSVDFSPVGDQVLSGARDGTSRIWDAATGAQIRSFPAVVNDPNPAVFALDGTRIFAASGMRLPRLWDALTGTQIRTFPGHTQPVYAVGLSPDGSKALTGGGDNIAILWNAVTGARLFTLSGHTGAVNTVAFSPDGAQVLTGSGDGTIRLWDVVTGTHAGTILQGSSVVSAVYSPDGRYIVSCGGFPGTAYLWDAYSGMLIRSFSEVPTDWTSMNGVAMSPDRSLIATTHSDDQVRLWQSGLGSIPIRPITALPVGSQVPVTMRSHGLYYFEVPTSGSRNLVISLDSATSTPGPALQSETDESGARKRFANLESISELAIQAAEQIDPTAIRMLAQKGKLPTSYEYQYFAQTPVSPIHAEIPVSPTASGKYYVLVYAPFLSAGSVNATIRADYVDFHLSSISPRRAGNAGNITAEIRGTGFTSQTAARLISPASKTTSGTTALLAGADKMFVTFNLRGKQTGLYDVQVTKPGKPPETLVDAFETTVGQGGRIEARLFAPSAVRPGRFFTMRLEYANVGDADATVPLFIISSETSPPMTLQQGGPYEHRPVQILGINFDGPAGVLPPGARYSIPIYCQAIAVGGVMVFDLETMIADGTRINWDEVGREVRPYNIDPNLWTLIWDNYTSQTGTTWADYLRSLAERAAYLQQNGSSTYDVRMLFSSALSSASGAQFRNTLESSTDAYSPAQGLPLSFVRTASDSLGDRLRVGPLGRVWYHNYEYLASYPDANTLVIEGPGGSQRTFIKDTSNVWQPSPGDHGAVEETGGGAFRIREKDGSLWQFDAAGRLAGVQDTNENQVSLVYTSNRLTQIHHSNGQNIGIQYNAQGRISQVTDPFSQVTLNFYDAGGEHLIRVLSPGDVATSYTYVAATGHSSDHALQVIGNADGTHQYYEYDSEGRLSGQWRDGGAERKRFTYDALGTVLVQNATSAVTTLRLDANGQPLEVRDALGNTTRFQYDAQSNLTRVTKPDGAIYQMSHDSRGNTTQIDDPLGNTTIMAYTSDHNRIDWLRDARGNTTDFTYDSSGNMTGITYPDSGRESFGYGLGGNLVSVRNRRGQTITFTYNLLGGLTRKTYPDGRTIDYTYDLRGNLVTLTDSLMGIISMQYDTHEFLTRIEYPGGYWFTFEYDNAGKRTRRTGHDGFILNYEYDAAGRLSRLTDGSGSEFIRYEYDANGRLSRENKGNGTYTTYQYDAAGQILHMINYGPGGAIQSRFDYTYDANGNRTSMTTLSGTTQYDYDALGQLIAVTYPGGRHVTYQYDSVGNRTTVADNGAATSYTTNNMNQYTSVGNAIYAYDADGNMISKTDASGTTSYGYDAGNRLVTVTTPTSGTWQYSYDALGNRISATHNSVVTRYVYDPVGLVDMAAEYNGGGALVARYVYAHGLVAGVDIASICHYYSFDAIGNTCQVARSDGTIANSYSYDPFGLTLARTEVFPSPFAYGGRYGIVTDSGLLFMRLRSYSPETGRYCSQDRLRHFGDNVNLYAYTGNSPLSFIDPIGNYRRAPSYGGAFSKGLTLEGLGTFMPGFGFWWNSLEALLSVREDRSWLNFWHEFGLWGLKAMLPIWLGPWGELPLANWWDKFTQDLGDKMFRPPKPRPPSYPRKTPTGSAPVQVPRPVDPNDKTGPAGVGIEHSISPSGEVAYTVRFENVSSATAPVQECVVVDYLDANLDWTTFKFGDVAFGDRVINIGSTLQQFSMRDYPSSPTVVGVTSGTLAVDITASINTQTGRVEWRLKAIDTATNLPPEDPFAGFLPPENGTGRGQGQITFSINPKANLDDGTQITNRASIVFDTEATINTNVVFNTITRQAPFAPFGPHPADSATSIAVTTLVDCSPSTFAAQYDMYLWKAVQQKPASPSAAGLNWPAYDPPGKLDYGMAYRWQVVARNQDGRTSGPVWGFTTVAGPSVPALAGEPAFTRGTTNTIFWTSSPGNPWCCLEWSGNSSFAPVLGNSSWTTATQFTVQGLGNGVRYYYRVKSRNDAMDESPWSNLVNSRQDSWAPVIQGVPTDTGAYTSSTTVRFNWTAANDLGSSGSGVASYDLQVGTTPGGSNVYSGNVGNVLTRTVAGTNSQRLYARVRARDAVGNIGAWSGSSDGILIDTVPPTEPGRPLDIGQFTSSTSVRFVWPAAADGGANPSGINTYELWVGTTIGANNVFRRFVGNTLGWTVVGANGQTLFAQVRAYDRVGNRGRWSGSSDGITVDTVRPRLTNLTVRNYCSLDITFDESVLNADKAANYTFTRGLGVREVTQRTPTSYRLYTTNQIPGTSYTVTIRNVTDRARNSLNPSPTARSFRGGILTRVRSWNLYR